MAAVTTEGDSADDAAITRADDRRVAAEIYPALRRFAASVGRWEVEPEDLVQEALRRTLQTRSLSDLDDPLAYLRVVILNLARNDARRRSRERAALPRLAQDPSTRDHYGSDLGLLDDLSPRVKAVLYLTAVEGLTTVDVARLLDLSEVAVRVRLMRGRRQLRNLFEQEARR